MESGERKGYKEAQVFRGSPGRVGVPVPGSWVLHSALLAVFSVIFASEGAWLTLTLCVSGWGTPAFLSLI